MQIAGAIILILRICETDFPMHKGSDDNGVALEKGRTELKSSQEPRPCFSWCSRTHSQSSVLPHFWTPVCRSQSPHHRNDIQKLQHSFPAQSSQLQEAATVSRISWACS